MLTYKVASSDNKSYKIVDKNGYLFLAYDYYEGCIWKAIRPRSPVKFYHYIVDMFISDKLSHNLAEKTITIVISGIIV